LAYSDGVKTIAGRFTNHAKYPNAVMRQINNKVYIEALYDINDEEVTIDYRESIGGKAALENMK